MENNKRINIYDLIGLPVGSSLDKIEERIKKYENLIGKNPTEESQRIMDRINKEYGILCEDKQAYDEKCNEIYSPFFDMVNENAREKVEETLEQRKVLEEQKALEEQQRFIEEQETNKANRVDANRVFKLYEETKYERKRAKNLKIKKMVVKIVATGLVCVCAFSVFNKIKNNIKKTNEENNVCVEYQVQDGDTKDKLSETFKDYGFSYYEVSGVYRNTNLVYAGDVVVGRTTKEKADELVEQGYARIISIDEAVELLGDNNSLIGEFRAYANGNSDMVFFVPDSLTKV